MRYRPILLFISFLGAVALPAQELIVEYVEGYLEIQDGGSWYELYIGDVVERDSSVRVDSGSYAEISDGAVTIKLLRPGVYTIGELLDSAQAQSDAGLGSLIAGRVGRLVGEDDRGAASAGGVRASEAATDDRMQWAGGAEVDELIEEGVTMLEEGDYEEAFYIFEEAYEYSSFDQEPDLLFLMGYSLAFMGETVDALDYFADAALDPENEYYDSYAVAYAQLLLETFAFEDAADLLDEYLVTAEDPADVQYAYLLYGMALRGAGRPDQAREALEEAAASEADPGVRRAARSLLN